MKVRIKKWCEFQNESENEMKSENECESENEVNFLKKKSTKIVLE